MYPTPPGYQREHRLSLTYPAAKRLRGCFLHYFLASPAKTSPVATALRGPSVPQILPCPATTPYCTRASVIICGISKSSDEPPTSTTKVISRIEPPARPDVTRADSWSQRLSLWPDGAPDESSPARSGYRPGSARPLSDTPLWQILTG